MAPNLRSCGHEIFTFQRTEANPHTMTTLLKNRVACAVCGAFSDQIRIQSTNAFGSPDLDLRPPEMQRSTMHCWVQACPHCGYCAGEISTPLALSSAVLAGDAYQSRLKNPNRPQLANRFLCKAMLDEAAGKLAEAAWASIHAAWACDDQRNEDAAISCRNEAVRLIGAAAQKSQQIIEQAGVSEVVLADLLRRAGRHEEARDVAAAALSRVSDETIEKCLRFEIRLADQRDTRVHRVADALNDTSSGLG
jgi:hypothetical protein